LTQAVHGLKETSDQEAFIESWREFSLVDDGIIIPIRPLTHPAKDNCMTPVHGNAAMGFLPSKVMLLPRFGVELSYAKTLHKSQGQTEENGVILAISQAATKIATITYSGIYVAFSRSRCSDKIKLLLNGDKLTSYTSGTCWNI
jgi:hypothetical protein